MLTKDEWKPVIGFPNYVINRNGQVRSLPGGKRRRKILTHLFNGQYPYVCMYRELDGEWKQFNRFIHILLLENFVGPRPKNYQAAHLNGNPMDFRLCNLKWVTAKENQAHRVAHGTHNHGQRNPYAKLTNEQVIEIVRLVRRGELMQKEIAAKFGVCRDTVRKIIRGESWCMITGIKRGNKLVGSKDADRS